MPNCQSFSRRRLLVAGSAAIALLSTPALAHAYPPGERDNGSATVTAAASKYEPVKISVPAPTGPNRIGTTELHLVDHTRQRELMVSVWYPARRDADGPTAKYMPEKTSAAVNPALSKLLGTRDPVFGFALSDTHARVGVPAQLGRHPVVLFSPGYQLSRFYNTALVEELASRGYVVVTMDHTHEGPVEFPGGRFVPGSEIQEPTAEQLESLIGTRVADTRFVLDQLTLLSRGRNPDADGRKLPRGLRQALDIHSVGMFGFSAGGHTAANAMYADGRIRAGVNLDGTLAYDPEKNMLGAAAVHGLDRPFLLFGSDTTQRTRPDAEYYDKSWASWWKAQRGWKLNLQLPGSYQFGFTDYQFFWYDVVFGLIHDEDIANQVQANTTGIVDRSRAMLAQRTYLTAFFDQTLRDHPQPLLENQSPDFPEISFVR
ncbi:hypothetical protein [Kribbella sp. NPDC023855]|uniref:alpha/beta hydrolase family protein n=1 Tax=Kribbella sp. NPDC023855 TaxID=3154698 RepID=UPI0034024B54